MFLFARKPKNNSLFRQFYLHGRAQGDQEQGYHRGPGVYILWPGKKLKIIRCRGNNKTGKEKKEKLTLKNHCFHRFFFISLIWTEVNF